MLDRRVDSFRDAIKGVVDGNTLILGGFGGCGVANGLVQAIMDAGVRDLTVVSNNAGTGEIDLSTLFMAGRVRKLICSFPRSSFSTAFDDLYRAKKIELELVPQGTLVERMRCAGAGLGGFFTPVAAGTILGERKEQRTIDGKLHVFESPLRGDVTFIRAKLADRYGNLTYEKSARAFSPVMATASKLVVVEVDEIVKVGTLDPEVIVTPCIFVDRVVLRGAPP